MTGKSKKVEQIEAFIVAWESEPSLWDVTCGSYKDRNKKQRSLRSIAEKCDMTGELFL